MNNDQHIIRFNVEAEQNVLGALMSWPDTFDEIAGAIKPDDFYRQSHQLIFEAITKLADMNIKHDVITVSDHLEKQKQLDDVGGFGYIGTLANNTPTSANIKAYADIVVNYAIERRLIDAANKVIQAVHGSGETESKISLVQRLIGGAVDSVIKDCEPVDIKSLLTEAVDEIDRLYQRGEEITGIRSGLDALDEFTCGYQPGDLIIIAGRPSMGKTTLAMNCGSHAAVNFNIPVAVFSLEMSGTKIIKREISSFGRINHHRTRSGKLQDDDWPKLTSAVGQLSQAKIYIDDTPGLSLVQLRAKARKLKRKHGIGLLIVDYIQLMSTEGRTRDEEVSGLTRGLKNLARELNIPIIALSQLNRSLESRPNKRPRLSDLRESGAIEQDADVIMFVYRDEVYNESGPFTGLAEIIIGKNRDGRIGTIHSTFEGEFCRFENFTGTWPEMLKTKSTTRGFDYRGNNKTELSSNA